MIEMIAAIGTVISHDVNMFLATTMLMPDRPRARPIPIIAPTSVWVVDIGSAIRVQTRTVVVAAMSAATPREGVISVIFMPTVVITR